MPPICIRSAVDGFRRAGIAHPAGTRTYPDGTFTAVELAQLEQEPKLSVWLEPETAAAVDVLEPTAPNSAGVDDLGPDAVAEAATSATAVEEAASPATAQGTVDANSVPDGLIDARLDGVVEPDGTQKSLDEMDEDEVRQIAKEMGIRNYHNMGFDKLIEKIKAEPVQITPQAEA